MTTRARAANCKTTIERQPGNHRAVRWQTRCFAGALDSGGWSRNHPLRAGGQHHAGDMGVRPLQPDEARALLNAISEADPEVGAGREFYCEIEGTSGKLITGLIVELDDAGITLRWSRRPQFARASRPLKSRSGAGRDTPESPALSAPLSRDEPFRVIGASPRRSRARFASLRSF